MSTAELKQNIHQLIDETESENKLESVLEILNEPEYLLKAIQAYLLMLFLRTVSIFFIPLEPPVGMILLIDPIGEFCLG